MARDQIEESLRNKMASIKVLTDFFLQVFTYMNCLSTIVKCLKIEI